MKKLSLKQTVSMILGMLGISAFTDNKMNDEQTEKVKGAFGEKFTEKFKAAIADESQDEEGKETVHAEGLYESIKAHFAKETQDATASIAAQLATSIADGKKKDGMIALLKAESENDFIPKTQDSWIGREGVAKVLTVARKAAHYAAVFLALNAGMGTVTAGTKTIEVEQLKTEFGTYLSQRNQNLTITKQIFTGFTSASEFRTVPATTEYQAIQAQVNSVSQQFSAKWTPSGAAKFTPLVIKNRRHKINYSIIPADVLDSYVFYLYDETLAPDQMPITKYIWQELIFPKLLEDIEKRMIFKGKYVANSTTTKPEDSMDGIEQILVTEKANAQSKINFYDKTINWATATDREVVDFINGFAEMVDDDLNVSKIYASRQIKLRYQRAYDNLYKGQSGIVGGINKDASIDYVEMTIVALKGMAKSPIIFATSPGNMVKLRHKNEAPFVINDVQKVDYEVRLFGEYWLGVGFEIAELVYAYVPANYDPQAGMPAHNLFPDGTAPADDGDSDGL
ncbi:hypothetical protein GCM10009120_44340 [Sphingobacterium siyangense subsp. cladoniae]|uniref:hypothetical protein n=1 Tax=Sphingobacterium siyangense TaxID=459529 RepID=UPI0031F9F0BD